MAVEIVEFQGKGSFFQYLLKGDTEYKNWNVRCNLDQPSLATFRKLQERDGDREGILNELKTDADGELYHHFRRPFQKDFGKGLEALMPPEILDKNNQPWDRRVEIGSGSDITVGCEIYPYGFRGKKGKGMRLVYVRVDNHIPYSREDFTDSQNKMVKGVDNVPLRVPYNPTK